MVFQFMQFAQNNDTQLATFAGGCFWCMVKPFDELPGIEGIVSGYTGGRTENPTYAEVGSETTGHFEAVQITFRPDIFPYERLLEIYWQLIDPTDDGGQFQDRGHSYRTAIFVHNEEQRAQAEASKRALQKSGRFKRPIVTGIMDAGRSIRRKTSIRITTRRIGAITICTWKARAGRRSRNATGDSKTRHG